MCRKPIHILIATEYDTESDNLTTTSDTDIIIDGLLSISSVITPESLPELIKYSSDDSYEEYIFQNFRHFQSQAPIDTPKNSEYSDSYVTLSDCKSIIYFDKIAQYHHYILHKTKFAPTLEKICLLGTTN